MNKTKITSHKQSGGITAKNVNFDNGSSQFNFVDEKKKDKNWKKIIIIISGIIAFVASIVTILAYFGK